MVQDLGGYRLIDELGSGGMGVVYLGVDGGNNPVAVKVLHPHIANDESARKRLAREVRTLRRIRHPRIAEVLDAELEAAQPFIITEFVDGQTLSDDVRDNGPFAEDELVHFGHALLDALNAVHDSGVIHRDLKPANVMIMDGEPMVIDFGIAQVADEVRVTATGLVMGTPGYLSPEIADGKPSSEKTDWWGWAATMAFAATGRNPYGSGPLEAVLGRVAMGKCDLSQAPLAFVPLLRACLDPKPERRPSGQMILDALVDIESGRMPQLGSGSLGSDSGAGQSPRLGTGTAVMPAVGAEGHGALRGGERSQGGPGLGSPPNVGAQQNVGPGHTVNRPNQTSTPRTGPGAHPMGYPQAQAGPYGTAVGGMVPTSPAPGLSGQAQGPGPAPGQGQPQGYGQMQARTQGNGQMQARPQGNGQMQGQGPRPGQQAGPQSFAWGPHFYQRARGGGWVVFALVILGIATMPLSPLVICGFAILWSVFARTATRLDRKAQRYRFEHGTQGRGTLRSVASAPAALLASVLTTAASIILPAIAGLAVLVLTRLDIAGIVPVGYSEEWSVWAAAAAGALVLWVGPGAASLRHGSQVLVAGATRNQLGRVLALSAIGLLIVLAVLAIQSGAGMTWWPLTDSPFSYLPDPV